MNAGLVHCRMSEWKVIWLVLCVRVVDSVSPSITLAGTV